MVNRAEDDCPSDRQILFPHEMSCVYHMETVWEEQSGRHFGQTRRFLGFWAVQ